MKGQALNPFLPLNVCIPDGEPHVFGDRIYLFGSHDMVGGNRFCQLDYEFFSAPLDDLSNWSSKGINYRASQDPSYSEDYDVMYAPDVVCGNDGRYYLYYAMSGKKFTGPIHVAVCDTPDGKYEYYGEVRNSDGRAFTSNITFDPAVINDGGIIRLYYGWALSIDPEALPENIRGGGEEALYPVYKMLFGKTDEELKNEPGGLMGAFTVELDSDMLTVRSTPKRIAPGKLDSIGSSFEGHSFFEGSSVRKINDTYYFVYSSEHQHELCYATSKYPDRDFTYGGIIISGGDIGYEGRRDTERINATGNNHGSIVQIGDAWYVFYHRHTHASCFSRQACAEKIELLEDGAIPQIPVSSCGLNNAPLEPFGEFSAAYCCGLFNSATPHLESHKKTESIPRIVCENEQWMVVDLCNETTLLFRYFKFTQPKTVRVYHRGDSGRLALKIGEFSENKGISASDDWQICELDIEAVGTHELSLTYCGEGSVDILKIEFLEK